MIKRSPLARPRTNAESEWLESLPSGVPGFDQVVGGGLPTLSFNMICGSPGCGKTTLAQQIVFANATTERPALYFTLLGEPTIKMLRYQQCFHFFDPALVGSAVQYINLTENALKPDLAAILEQIDCEVRRTEPAIVVIDSFNALMGLQSRTQTNDSMSVDTFVQQLALQLATWEVTSFVLGENADSHTRAPVYAVADGVLALSQVTDRNSVVRKLQVLKLRGRATMPGLHTFRITHDGVQIFPRLPESRATRKAQQRARLGTGVPGLDDLMDGGIPIGDAVVLAGPAGSGKTTFATQFAAEGLKEGESVVIVVFEEHPEEYLARAKSRNNDIGSSVAEGKLKMIYLRPLDLSVDETSAEIRDAVTESGATRVVIDSLSGFEIALAPAFRDDFRESLYRLVGALTATGVTILMTTEIVGDYPNTRIGTEKVWFVTDDILVQRFVEIDGMLRSVLVIHKMRGSTHSHEFSTYEITPNGAAMSGALKNLHGIMTGVPERESYDPDVARDGLTGLEADVLSMVKERGTASRALLLERAGTTSAEMGDALARLSALGYASQTNDTEETYRASRRTLQGYF